MKPWYEAIWQVLQSGLTTPSALAATTEDAPRDASPLSLAYLGDAVYEAYVRARLVAADGGRPASLHVGAVARVQAAAQARILDELEPLLTDAERDVVRRARNARPGHTPRGVRGRDYHRSTAFEALLGHLLVTGETDRLAWVLSESWRIGNRPPAEQP